MVGKKEQVPLEMKFVFSVRTELKVHSNKDALLLFISTAIFQWGKTFLFLSLLNNWELEILVIRCKSPRDLQVDSDLPSYHPFSMLLYTPSYVEGHVSPAAISW